MILCFLLRVANITDKENFLNVLGSVCIHPDIHDYMVADQPNFVVSSKCCGMWRRSTLGSTRGKKYLCSKIDDIVFFHNALDQEHFSWRFGCVMVVAAPLELLATSKDEERTTERW